MPTTILFESTDEEPNRDEEWIQLLSTSLPQYKVLLWSRVKNPLTKPLNPDFKHVQFVVVWFTSCVQLSYLPNLQAVLLRSSGADHIGSFHHLPMHVPIIRLVDPSAAQNMARYVLHWVLHFHMRFDEYRRLQQQGIWHRVEDFATPRYVIGVLGYGGIGRVVCELLCRTGYDVRAWCRTQRTDEEQKQQVIRLFAPPTELSTFLQDVDVLVNVLPLTDDTHGLVNRRMLGHVRKGACLISIGRGPTIVVDDVLSALNTGHLRNAVLDTYEDEPLSRDSLLWSHPNVVVTPHIAGYAHPQTSVPLLVDNIKRIVLGDTPFPAVDRERGY